MKLVFVDNERNSVTITDPVTVYGDPASLNAMAKALSIGGDSVPGIMVMVEDQNGVADLPPPMKPWESSPPPEVVLSREEVMFLEGVRKKPIKISDLSYDLEKFAQDNSDGEHRLVSIYRGHVVIAPGGAYALSQLAAAAAETLPSDVEPAP